MQQCGAPAENFLYNSKVFKTSQEGEGRGERGEVSEKRNKKRDRT